MKDQYHVNTENFSLDKFKNSIESRDMIPSRVALKEDLNKRFKAIELSELKNLKELIDRLKTKQKIATFSRETGLSVEYLTLLRREANSFLPNPVRLNKFPGISERYVKLLEDEGIKNSKHLISQANLKELRSILSSRIEIPIEFLNELVCLSDLVRAYGVGPVFARIIYDVGIRTIEAFTEGTAEEFIQLYEEKEQKKADFGVHEIQFSLELAKELDIIVQL